MRKLSRVLATLLLLFTCSMHVAAAAQGIPQYHRSKLLLNAQSIAASGTTTIELDLEGVSRVNIFLRQTYDATAATTGVSVVQDYASVDPTQVGEVFVYAGNTTNVTTIDPTAAQGTEQVTVSEWNVGVLTIPRKIRFSITNKDNTNAVSIDLWADMN